MSEHDELDGFEERLHDMLEERGAQPVATPQAPPEVLRRTRRRQVSTALVSGVTAVAVIFAAILGVQAIGRGGGGGTIGAEHDSGSTRTVALDGYRVTYPYDWALQRAMSVSGIDPGGPMVPATAVPTPVGTFVEKIGTATTGGGSAPGLSGPVGGDTAGSAKAKLAAIGQALQLSNQYPDHLLDLSCDGGELPADGVAFQVHPEQPESASGDGHLGDPTTCPDGSTRYTASFTGDGGAGFVATALVGGGASSADRTALFDAFDSIEYPSVGQGVFMGGGGVSSGSAEGDAPNAPTPPDTFPDTVSTVVAGGTTDSGADWSIVVDGGLTSTEVQFGDTGIGWATASSSSGGQASVPDLDATVSSFAAGSPPIVVGSVVGTATRVEVRPDGGSPIEVPLLGAPAVTGIQRSFFLTELPDLSSDTGTVVALDASGGTVGRQDYDVNGNGVEPAPPVCRAPKGGANDDPTCPPMPMPCPTVAGGDKSSVKECIDCPDNAMCAVPSCPPDAAGSTSSTSSGNANDPVECITCREVTTATTGADGTSSGGGCAGGGWTCYAGSSPGSTPDCPPAPTVCPASSGSGAVPDCPPPPTVWMCPQSTTAPDGGSSAVCDGGPATTGGTASAVPAPGPTTSPN